MVFLLVFLIPHIGTNWLNYILPLRNVDVDIVIRSLYLFLNIYFSCGLCVPLMLTVKEKYNRMQVDKIIDNNNE